MNDLHFPWLELSILIPFVGALWVFRLQDPFAARKWCLVLTCLTTMSSIAAWQDFLYLHSQTTEAIDADDPWHLLSQVLGKEIFVIDELSAPLLPLVALLYFLTTIATVRTKIRRFSFAWNLISESITLATFSCKDPKYVIGLLAAGTIPPYLELKARGRPTRVYVLHMGLFVGLMMLGWYFVEIEGLDSPHSWYAIVPLVLAMLIRSGSIPFHCWMTDLYERATFGTALLFTTPIAGAYGAIRLVVPTAPNEVLRTLGLLSLITAVYAAGMALIQREGRRFFCYLLLSHSALVLVGLELVGAEHETPVGLTGGLCVWLSVVLSLGGFGLTLRAIEARRGRVSLAEFQGLYENTPTLAVSFFLTGLASVGFPATVGYVSADLLVDGVVESYPYVGIAVVIAAALNGIAMVRAYFLIFTGKRHASSVSLKIGYRERFAVLLLAGLILVGGLVPQPGIETRYRAADELLKHRALKYKEATAKKAGAPPASSNDSP